MILGTLKVLAINDFLLNGQSELPWLSEQAPGCSFNFWPFGGAYSRGRLFKLRCSLKMWKLTYSIHFRLEVTKPSNVNSGRLDKRWPMITHKMSYLWVELQCLHRLYAFFHYHKRRNHLRLYFIWNKWIYFPFIQSQGLICLSRSIQMSTLFGVEGGSLLSWSALTNNCGIFCKELLFGWRMILS